MSLSPVAPFDVDLMLEKEFIQSLKAWAVRDKLAGCELGAIGTSDSWPDTGRTSTIGGLV
jgi:hypothetical protein